VSNAHHIHTDSEAYTCSIVFSVYVGKEAWASSDLLVLVDFPQTQHIKMWYAVSQHRPNRSIE